ncbi:hypothetical protein EDB85DRAFT_2190953 [Lactarius pseudohatsudake]|nr:hypothetical protein EDB85DRAFT_2190953 [Lactarius pseudohatsudake]
MRLSSASIVRCAPDEDHRAVQARLKIAVHGGGPTIVSNWVAGVRHYHLSKVWKARRLCSGDPKQQRHVLQSTRYIPMAEIRAARQPIARYSVIASHDQEMMGNLGSITPRGSKVPIANVLAWRRDVLPSGLTTLSRPEIPPMIGPTLRASFIRHPTLRQGQLPPSYLGSGLRFGGDVMWATFISLPSPTHITALLRVAHHD